MCCGSCLFLPHEWLYCVIPSLFSIHSFFLYWPPPLYLLSLHMKTHKKSFQHSSASPTFPLNLQPISKLFPCPQCFRETTLTDVPANFLLARSHMLVSWLCLTWTHRGIFYCWNSLFTWLWLYHNCLGCALILLPSWFLFKLLLSNSSVLFGLRLVPLSSSSLIGSTLIFLPWEQVF